ncbi:MAG: TRAP transporter substrate-binding protein DctP [Lachnospiraceae bacterium]|nr:TRAP transporter substrate-binding protein DctP [Lachnospiraceae bacterium]
MKKKILSITLCMAFAGVLLAGCGTESSSDTSSASAAASASEGSADAEEETYELVVTSHDPRTSATGEFLEAWAAAVREASDRRINIIIQHNSTLASANESYDFVLEGKTDIAWGLQSAYADEFPITEVFSLPMLDIDDAVEGSEALWKFYNETDYLDEEYSKVHVLLLHTNCQSPIALVDQKVTTVEELSSMNIRANDGPAALMAENLGATPVSVTINDLYSSLMNRECDAAITDWHAIRSFALNGVCDYYLDENMGVSTYFMVMNLDSYNSLPEDLQEILDETSAEAIQYASIWNVYEEEVRNLITLVDPRAIYTFSDEEEAKLQAAAEETAADWIEEMTELGYDGQAIYDAAVECIEAVKQ